MRCPQCEVFVSYGEDFEPEIESEELDGATISGQVRVVLDCADCGTELKETTLDYEMEIEHDCPKVSDYTKEEPPEFSISDTTTEFTSRLQTTDRHGKPIKNSRYMRTYYGAVITTVVECSLCETEIKVSTDVEEMASNFDEI